MATLTTEIKLADLPSMRELFDILAANFDGLPEQVQGALRALGDGEALVWDNDYLITMGVYPVGVTVFADGVTLDDVKALHPFTQEVEMGDGTRVKAEKAEIRNADGNGVRGWA